MFKVVIDTNIIVSGIISSSGSPYEVLKAWKNRKFFHITSPSILNEVERVFHYPKIKESYNLETKTIHDILLRLSKYSFLTEEKLQVDEIKEDITDNLFLACAKESNADFIVTGDKHLLDLRDFEGTTIVTSRHFIEIINERLR